MSVKNYTEYFKDEHDIYVQNLADAQVSCEFPLGEGRVEGFTFPHNRDPLNLTQFIPFGAIKNSMDFRKMLSRRPPALHLLTEEEYTAYYARRAKARGLTMSDGAPDVDAAMDAAEEKRRRTADKSMREIVATSAPKPIHDVVERGSGPGGAKHFGEKERVVTHDVATEDEIINPRVLHLCNQVKNEIPEEERMPAAELLMALQDLPNLTLDDLEHIRAHAWYKSVKKWAKQESANLVSSDDDDDEAGQQLEA